ncbi:MAG: TetR/AcrR family transcriptional regulator C-terminal domain-containing protein [Firmicutes bacterium]|nr:TetR/AcrR family transcriptional regulator [Bacillota bacterium]MDD7601213.1 TetR/AcrR family transcriptional regulator C-terminal domain-containing protein [Bacillota bacterium]MDY5857434.1 TetR/AcrR family transcriptional regulator C-terminal domain-containing protein [Anaerovoracaceae bacterium]
MDEKQEKMKYRLADAMKQCMRSSSAEKITVQEIADAAGTTRQTFYRHFLDKYDLMNWYFDKILQESFKQMGEGRTVYEGLVKKFEFIEEENTFFRAAFQSDAQNNLKEHDFQMILRFYTEKMEEASGEALSERLRFLLEMYCQGSIYMTVQWVSGRLHRSPEEMAGELVAAMPGELAEVFRSLHLL